MNLFDYMNLVSGYIISKLENKRDMNNSINFIIKPKRNLHTNELFYEIEEKLNDKDQLFYLSVPCSDKRDFYVGKINHEKIDAKYKDGILVISVPKNDGKKESILIK